MILALMRCLTESPIRLINCEKYTKLIIVIFLALSGLPSIDHLSKFVTFNWEILENHGIPGTL